MLHATETGLSSGCVSPLRVLCEFPCGLCDNLFVQAEWIIQDNRPPDDWPDAGSIVIEDLDLKYRDGLPFVLKQISCGIKPGEKVH